MKVCTRTPISILIGTLAIVGASFAARPKQSGPSAVFQANARAQALSDEEIRSRTKKLLANQHADDDALELYERIEHHIDRTGGPTPHTIEDRTYRVVPTGAGNQKILLREEGKPADPAGYARQMQILKDLLTTMANPDDSRAKVAYAKYDKRKRERTEFVDAASEAYTTRWGGREIRDGRDCDIFELDPDPKFQPRSMFQEAFAHTTAKLWVDRQVVEIVHAEAHVTSDISFGGGILGKLYRGSVVSMDQLEIAPGIWLSTHYQYDFTGRKFLFSFDQHQLIDVTHYRRVGPPKEALRIVQAELSSGKTFSEDP